MEPTSGLRELRAFVEDSCQERSQYRDLRAGVARMTGAIWFLRSQQTQVSRVDGRWQSGWSASQRSCAGAAAPSVVTKNGRAWGLQPSCFCPCIEAAQAISEAGEGVFPLDGAGKLPNDCNCSGCSGVRSAFNLHGVYLETTCARWLPARAVSTGRGRAGHHREL